MCRYDFPSRWQAYEAVLALVLQHPRHAVVIAVDSLGKGKPFMLLSGSLAEYLCSGCVASLGHIFARGMTLLSP